MPKRRIILEEDGDEHEQSNNDDTQESSANSGDSVWRPSESPPPDYGDQQAKVHISDLILQPLPEKLREFSNTPDAFVPLLVLADVMSACNKEYQGMAFNAVDVVISSMDARMRGRNGWITNRAIVLAGDEQRGDDINPAQGPQL